MTPSNGSEFGKSIPAIADRVGYISKDDMGVLEVSPKLILPGQDTMKGTLIPPSKYSHL